MKCLVASVFAMVCVAQMWLSAAGASWPSEWTEQEKAVVASLALFHLRKDQTVHILGHEVKIGSALVKLGEGLFFDRGLSRSGSLSCAGCHDPSRAWSSGQLVVAPGVGPRSVPSLFGVGRMRFFFWDGRADSLWSQSVGPLTSAQEHGLSRSEVVRRVLERHGLAYASAFGVPEPGVSGSEPSDRADQDVIEKHFKNVLVSLAAYQSFIWPEPTRFDTFAEELTSRGSSHELLPCEETGLRVFIGKGQCMNCHSGPLFTNRFFHSTGVPPTSDFERRSGFGERFGLRFENPWACEKHSSDPEQECRHTLTLRNYASLYSAFKTPGLRGVSKTSPYMHNGVYQTLAEVVEHYVSPPDSGMTDLDIVPLDLSRAEREGLVCFLKTL